MGIGQDSGKTREKMENTKEYAGTSAERVGYIFVKSFKDRIVFKVPFLPRPFGAGSEGRLKRIEKETNTHFKQQHNEKHIEETADPPGTGRNHSGIRM